MAYESIKVDIIPGAENAEVLHFSQFDNKRPFFIELFNGADEFIPEAGMTITLECRKRDGNIVIISDPVMNDNVAEFSTTEQLTACYGDNMAEIKIVDDNDLVIGSANFIINVEKSPTCGGLVSESEIDNLTQQIEEIAQEVIGDDYYNKAQTDALLAQKADLEDLPDMSRYYNKYEINNLLSNYVLSSYLTTNYYSRSDSRLIFVSKGELQIAMQLEGQASGSIATFETAAPEQRLAALKCNFLCSGGNGTPSTPIPLVPYTELNVTNCGSNLINISDCIDDYYIRSGDLTITSIADASVFYCDVPKNTDLTITPDKSNRCVILGYYNRPSTVAGSVGDVLIVDSGSGITSRTFNTGNCQFLAIYLNRDTANKPTQIMLNVGTTPTAYEPYNADTITIDLDGTRYGGYVDANNGKLVLTFAVVDLGTLNYQDATSSGTHYFYINSSEVGNLGMKAESYPTSTNIISPIFTAKSNNNWIGGALTNDYEFCRNVNNVCFRYDSISTTADFKTAMDGINMVYELATPIEVDISPEYLNAHTGINNVSHDGNGTTEVKYKDTIQHYIDSRV